MKNIKNADDYLAWIKSIITLCPEVVNLTIIREESQIDRGLWRYRVMLKDSSLLEMFEFFKIELDKVEIIKYSFHSQKENGEFIKRWDNALNMVIVVKIPIFKQIPINKVRYISLTHPTRSAIALYVNNAHSFNRSIMTPSEGIDDGAPNIRIVAR
jgi:hypothetical protein